MWHWEALQVIRWLLLSFLLPQRCLYISSLFFTFLFALLYPHSAAIPVCSTERWRWPVLLCASVSLTSPTWQHSNIKQRGGKNQKIKNKLNMQYMDLLKKVEINTFKNKWNVFAFSFPLPNTKWCFIFRLGEYTFICKAYLKMTRGMWRSRLELRLFL